MASKTERTIINAAGLAQGIVLVTFPAASTIFTDTSEYGLSSTQYGAGRRCARHGRMCPARWDRPPGMSAHQPADRPGAAPTRRGYVEATGSLARWDRRKGHRARCRRRARHAGSRWRSRPGHRLHVTDQGPGAGLPAQQFADRAFPLSGGCAGWLPVQTIDAWPGFLTRSSPAAVPTVAHTRAPSRYGAAGPGAGPACSPGPWPGSAHAGVRGSQQDRVRALHREYPDRRYRRDGRR